MIVPSADSAEFVVAVDAGGTHTRVACFALDGSLLSSSRGRGGSPTHNDDAAQNVSATLTEAFEMGNLSPANAVGMAAGSAGIRRHQTNEWADAFYAFPSLTCPCVVVNDAVTAHRGALLGEPGVIVVAGTGSMILAITEDGEEIENEDFEHYAGGARHLVFDVMHRILSGSIDDADEQLVAEVLAYWRASGMPDLRHIILRLASADRNEVKRLYGGLAPKVTAAADTSPLADAALRALAERTARGVLVLAPLIGSDRVPVSVTGALAADPAFSTRLDEALVVGGATKTQLVEPQLDPIGGAAIVAYELAGVATEHVPIARLIDSTKIRIGQA